MKMECIGILNSHLELAEYLILKNRFLNKFNSVDFNFYNETIEDLLDFPIINQFIQMCEEDFLQINKTIDDRILTVRFLNCNYSTGYETNDEVNQFHTDFHNTNKFSKVKSTIYMFSASTNKLEKSATEFFIGEIGDPVNERFIIKSNLGEIYKCDTDTIHRAAVSKYIGHRFFLRYSLYCEKC